MIQQAVGYKFFPNKNLIDNDKRDTKNRISFLFAKKERVKKYAKKEKISCTFACSGCCTSFFQSPLTAQAAGEGSITRKITVVKGKDINDM